MHGFFNRNKQLIPVTMIAFMLIIGVTVLFSLMNNKTNNSSNTINKEIDTDINSNEKYDEKFLGVITDINQEINAISIMDVNSSSDVVLYFNGGTDIRDKYNEVIAMSQMIPGEMVDVYYEKDSNKLTKLQISKDAWEYNGVENYTIHSGKKMVQIADSKYQFNDRLVIMGGNGRINLIDINEKDELTLKGVGEKIWSIIVTKGHGYIRLKNYNDFIDGTIEVGYQIILPVVSDMLIVAREGDYKVTLEKGKLKGSKHVNVIRDQEVILDMSEYRNEVTKTGSVDFLIQPYGALLYIDGEEVDYEKPIDLNYGSHVVKVSLGGYSTYSGILNVNESSKVVEINLAQEIVSEDLTEISNSNETKPNVNVKDKPKENTSENTSTSSEEDKVKEDEEVSDTDNDTTSNTRKVDNEHTIKVEKPVGAEVYLNGVLKGTVPYSFAKEIGTHTITLSKNGYITKSYTIAVLDDSKDISFSFPDMEAKQ